MSAELISPPAQTAANVVANNEIMLSKHQKAAILLSVLMGGEAKPNLDDVETSALKNIVDIMASFGEVDQKTIDLIILEFLSELQKFGISMRGNIEETIESLKGHISDKALEKIRNAYVHSPAISPWVRVAKAEAKDLQACLEKEFTPIAAIALSKIPSTLAAEVLGGMEPAQARSIMLAIINAEDVGPEVIEMIGQGIADTIFADTGPQVFDKSPVERAGDIMNFAQSETRDRLLADFGENDPETAEKIRKVMFTFADIPDRIQPRDVSAVTRAVNPETLLQALKGGEADHPTVVEFILSSLSSRAADQLREEITESEPVKKRDAETAMNQIIVGIRSLESEGTITLITEEEEEEE